MHAYLTVIANMHECISYSYIASYLYSYNYVDL